MSEKTPIKKIPILHYQLTGSGPLVVLLHGFLMSSIYWQKVVPGLSKDFTVMTVDLLGFGASPKPHSSSYDLAAHIISLHKTLLGVSSPMTIVGHSMGAVIAAEYARLYPDSVTQLVAVNPPIFNGSKEAEQDIKGTALTYRLMLYTKIGRLLWPVLGTVARSQRASGNPKALRSFTVHHTHASRMGSLKNLIQTERFLDILKQVNVPTLILFGKHDRALYEKNLTKQAAHISDVQARAVLTGHHIPWYMPEVLVEEIQKLA